MVQSTNLIYKCIFWSTLLRRVPNKGGFIIISWRKICMPTSINLKSHIHVVAYTILPFGPFFFFNWFSVVGTWLSHRSYIAYFVYNISLKHTHNNSKNTHRCQCATWYQRARTFTWGCLVLALKEKKMSHNLAICIFACLYTLHFSRNIYAECAALSKILHMHENVYLITNSGGYRLQYSHQSLLSGKKIYSFIPMRCCTTISIITLAHTHIAAYVQTASIFFRIKDSLISWQIHKDC